jgi:hypothetical protein
MTLPAIPSIKYVDLLTEFLLDSHIGHTDAEDQNDQLARHDLVVVANDLRALLDIVQTVSTESVALTMYGSLIRWKSKRSGELCEYLIRFVESFLIEPNSR